MVGRQAVGHGEGKRLLDQHLLGVGAGRESRESDRVHLLAATDQRHRDDGGSLVRRLAAPGPVLGDASGELVAEGDRLIRAHEVVVARLDHDVGKLVAVAPRVKVGAADAGARHLDQELPFAGYGRFAFHDRELSVLARNRLHHPQGKPLCRFFALELAAVVRLDRDCGVSAAVGAVCGIGAALAVQEVAEGAVGQRVVAEAAEQLNRLVGAGGVDRVGAGAADDPLTVAVDVLGCVAEAVVVVCGVVERDADSLALRASTNRERRR